MRKKRGHESLPGVIIEALRVPLLLLDADQRVLLSNREYCRVFKIQSAECVGKALSRIGEGQWRIKGLRVRLKLIVSRNKAFKDFEVRVDFPKVGRRILLIAAHRAAEGKPSGQRQILLTFEDVTQRRKQEIAFQEHSERLARSNRDLERFASIAARELLTPLRRAVKSAESIARRYKSDATAQAAGCGKIDIDIDIDADNLTPRERDILTMVADGATNKEIAEKLMIGLRTVETHRQNLMVKLGIRTVAGLTKYGLASGLIKLQ